MPWGSEKVQHLVSELLACGNNWNFSCSLFSLADQYGNKYGGRAALSIQDAEEWRPLSLRESPKDSIT